MLLTYDLIFLFPDIQLALQYCSTRSPYLPLSIYTCPPLSSTFRHRFTQKRVESVSFSRNQKETNHLIAKVIAIHSEKSKKSLIYGLKNWS
jgi:hypothetical protein